jgi:hypothetical protein
VSEPVQRLFSMALSDRGAVQKLLGAGAALFYICNHPQKLLPSAMTNLTCTSQHPSSFPKAIIGRGSLQFFNLAANILSLSSFLPSSSPNLYGLYFIARNSSVHLPSIECYLWLERALLYFRITARISFIFWP